MIRELSPDDAPAAARLLSAVWRHGYHSAANARHFWATTPERARKRRWGVERDGLLVGFAMAGFNVDSTEDGAAYANVAVLPAQRRQGIGGALWETVERHLAEIGARHVVSEGLDTTDARRFMAARGFQVTAVERMSGLDPRTLERAPDPPPGVEIVPLSAFAEEPRALFDLYRETVPDIPFDQPLEGSSWDDWLTSLWRDPELDREVGVAALVDGRPAAFTYVLVASESGRAFSAMTGTARDFRGRGLARLVKHHALERAAAAGVTLALTTNSEDNAAMLAVNVGLGYEPLDAMLIFTRRGAGTASRRAPEAPAP